MIKKILLFVLLVAAVFAMTFERVTSTALSAGGSAPRRAYGAHLVEDGLVAFYPFNGNAEDESGCGHSGIVLGPVPAADRHGMARSAYLFDGVDDYIEIPPVVTTDAFSVSLWISGYPKVATSHLYQGGPEWNLAYDDAGCLSFEVKLADNNWYIVRGGRYPAAWMHVVGTYRRGESIRLYVNDALAGERNGLPALPMNSTGFGTSIGAVLGGASDYFEGALDDIRIYSRVLSPADVHLLFRESAQPSGAE
jgi:hypothetical protein